MKKNKHELVYIRKGCRKAAFFLFQREGLLPVIKFLTQAPDLPYPSIEGGSMEQTNKFIVTVSKTNIRRQNAARVIRFFILLLNQLIFTNYYLSSKASFFGTTGAFVSYLVCLCSLSVFFFLAGRGRWKFFLFTGIILTCLEFIILEL